MCNQSATAPAVPVVTDRQVRLAYRQWALRQTLNDFRSGFPLLKSLKNSQADFYLKYVDSLLFGNKERFVTALANRVHSESGSAGTGVDRTLVNDYLQQRESETRRPRRMPGDRAPAFEFIAGALNIMGPCEALEDNCWRFSTSLLGHSLFTVVKVGRPTMRYYQSLCRATGTSLLANVSLL